MATITEPALAVLSGPLVRRNDCKRALEGVGLIVLDPEPLPEDPSAARLPHRGLAAYRNPDEALEAGKPNSGHTPGTEHPETGDAYEDDTRIGFLDVRIPDSDGALDKIAGLAEDAKFALRLH